MKKLFATLCLALSVVGASAQNYFGYTNTDYERNGGVRFGTSTAQGQAIRLSGEKLDMMRGKQITGIHTAFGTRNLDALTFFVTTDLNGTPAVSEDMTGASTSWRDFSFSTPYTIGDESELYIGYTLSCSTSYNPLQFDKGQGLPGTSYRYNGTAWTDAYNDGYGNASMQVIVADVGPFTDVIAKPISANGYFLAEQPYVYSGQVFNFGTETINSFDITFRMGDGEEQVYSYSDLNLASNQAFDFSLPEYTSTVSGNLAITVGVRNINGAEDSETSDNSATSYLYIYPADMERNLLLEGFTGQSCPNCPNGHVSINSALAAFDAAPVVECFHHSGYALDEFSMTEDVTYLNFFPNPESTSAPNFMVNRLQNGLSPVGGGSGFTTGEVLTMLETAAAIQPYVSVGIESHYDEATRKLTGTMKVYTHVMPDAELTTFSIFLVQDSVIGYQIGASNAAAYAHRYAFRGSLTGALGGVYRLEEGQTVEYDFEYDLPEIITSEYAIDMGGDGVVGIVPEIDKMYLLAFVSKYQDVDQFADLDFNDLPVYNATMAKFGENTQVVNIEEDFVENNSAVLRVDGNNVRVNGDFDRIEVYDMSGRLVETLGAPAYTFTLSNGFYVARIVSGNHVKTQKLAVY